MEPNRQQIINETAQSIRKIRRQPPVFVLRDGTKIDKYLALKCVKSYGRDLTGVDFSGV